MNDGMKNVLSDLNDWQDQIAGYPVEDLCTDYCPCPPLTYPTNATSWLTKYVTNMTNSSDTNFLLNQPYETRANKYGRSFYPTLQKSKNNKTYTPFVFAKSTDSSTSYYKTYWDCVSVAI